MILVQSLTGAPCSGLSPQISWPLRKAGTAPAWSHSKVDRRAGLGTLLYRSPVEMLDSTPRDSVPNCVGESFGGRRRPQHLAEFRQIAGGQRALRKVTNTRWNRVRRELAAASRGA